MTTARPEHDTEIKFHTPPANQGQAVIVSYAAAYPWVIRREHDRGIPQRTYSVSRMRQDDDGDYWNAPPDNKRWRDMTPDELDAFGIAH